CGRSRSMILVDLLRSESVFIDRWHHSGARLRACLGCRISGQNSRAIFTPASTPRETPLDESPLANVCSRAGCQSREINPPAKAPETRPVAMVGSPVFFFRATTVLTRACRNLGLNPDSPDR